MGIHLDYVQCTWLQCDVPEKKKGTSVSLSFLSFGHLISVLHSVLRSKHSFKAER